MNSGCRHARRVVAAAGDDPRFVEEARRDADETPGACFHAVGWSVTVRWQP